MTMGGKCRPSAALTNSQSDTADIVKQALGFSLLLRPLHTRRYTRGAPPALSSEASACQRAPARQRQRATAERVGGRGALCQVKECFKQSRCFSTGPARRSSRTYLRIPTANGQI